MSRLRRFKPSGSMLVALLALVMATTGSAVAASLITSSQIKDGTIQTKDISKKARTALKGQKGASGASGLQGPKGDKGDKGDTGAAGAAGATGETGAPGANGSARAYAFVTASGVIDANRAKGFSAIAHTASSGLYCLTPDPSTGIDTTKAVAAVSVEFNNSAGLRLFGFWAKDQCGAGKIGVLTANEDAGPGTTWSLSDEGFSVVVP